MEQLYRLVMQSGDENRVTVSSRTASRLGLTDGRPTRLLTGDRAAEVRVAVHDVVAEATLIVSRTALEALLLNSSVARQFRYRIRWQNGALRLGPVIGLLIGMSREEIPRNRHGYRIFDTLWAIRRIGGLTYFFTADDIDWRKKRIFGHVHFARRDNSLLPKQIPFQTAWFPFPQAIYRRGRIAPEVMERIGREITPHSFNTPKAAGRLQQIEAVRSVAELRPHIPRTESLNTDSLRSMVGQYGVVYLKANGFGAGKSVHKVEAASEAGSLYRVTSRFSSRSAEEKTRQVASYRRLIELLSDDLGRPSSPGLWTVQQGIRPALWNGRPFDLRVTVQKNGRGNWFINGAYARIAPSPTSAITRLGEYRSAREIVTALWPVTGAKIIREARRIGLLCAGAFERRFVAVGDLGVDLILDKTGKAWFLEANVGPGYRPIDAEDQDYWWQITQPVLYASYLSGFPISLRRDDLLQQGGHETA